MRIDRLGKVRNILFYLALFVECAAVIVDKSRLINPYTTWLFRGTAIAFLLVLLLTEYTTREWAIIALAIGLGIASYLYTGRDEITRVAIFAAACKEIPLKRSLGVAFFTTLTGCLAIAVLAVTGIFGEVSVTQLYRLEDGISTRITLGFGHPNALQCMYYMLLLMTLYVFDRYLRWYLFLALAVLTALICHLTDSRTGIIMGIFSLLFAVTMHYPLQDDPGRDAVARFQRKSLGTNFLDIGLRSKKWVYAAGGLVAALCVAFSVFAAYISDDMWMNPDAPLHRRVQQIDMLINNRITNLYWTEPTHAGSLQTWTLFGSRNTEYYFDMGWVRLFYWYGIIPAAIAILLLLFLIAECYRKRDGQALMLIVSLSVYTVIEAHLVSIYIGRNFLLLILGAYWSSMLKAEHGETYYLPELIQHH